MCRVNCQVFQVCCYSVYVGIVSFCRPPNAELSALLQTGVHIACLSDTVMCNAVHLTIKVIFCVNVN